MTKPYFVNGVQMTPQVSGQCKCSHNRGSHYQDTVTDDSGVRHTRYYACTAMWCNDCPQFTLSDPSDEKKR